MSVVETMSWINKSTGRVACAAGFGECEETPVSNNGDSGSRYSRGFGPGWPAQGLGSKEVRMREMRYCQILWMGEVRRRFPEPSIHP